MSNLIPLINPYLKNEKFKRGLRAAERDREKELGNYSETGFDSKEHYRAFLDQRDRSSANVQQSARNFLKAQEKAQEVLNEVKRRNGENSPEVEFTEFALPASQHAAFEATLKHESEELQAVTPPTLRKPKSRSRKVAGGILGGISVAAVGAYAFLPNGELEIGPKIRTDPNLPSYVVNPAKPQISDATVQEIVEEGDDLTSEQVKNKVTEVINSSDYQKQATELAEQTNVKLEGVIKDLNQSYANIDEFVDKNFQGFSDYKLVRYDYHGVDDPLTRGDDENVVAYLTRLIHYYEGCKDYYGTPMVEEFKEKFPNLVKYYNDNDVEINIETVLFQSDDLGPGGIERASKLDLAETGNSYLNFLYKSRGDNLRQIFADENGLLRCLDVFRSKLSEDQLQEFERLLQESNSTFENYMTTINDYNTGIAELQKEFVESLLLSGYDEDIITAMLVDGKDSNQTFDDLVEPITNQEQQSNTLDSIADASDNVIDAVSDALGNAFP